MKINMIALQYQNYEGSWYKAGEPIAVKSKGDADDMVCMHMAKYVPVTKQEKAPESEAVPETASIPAAHIAEAVSTHRGNHQQGQKGARQSR